MKNLGLYDNNLSIPRKQDIEAVKNSIPTKVSQLTNDSNFATTTYVENAIRSIADGNEVSY